jgi:hypothetical protein
VNLSYNERGPRSRGRGARLGFPAPQRTGSRQSPERGKDDERDDVVLLVARSKLDGGILGTIRIQPNLKTLMHLESVIALPYPFNKSRCVEFIRLGVLNGSSGRLVSSALAKASYEICVAMKMDYIFLCSRSPVDTMYRKYRFDDFLEGKKLELH